MCCNKVKDFADFWSARRNENTQRNSTKTNIVFVRTNVDVFSYLGI